MDAIVAHYLDTLEYKGLSIAEREKKGSPNTPAALALSHSLGDYRMIVAGGVWDQPAGEWAAARYAGYLWHILETRQREAEMDISSLKSSLGDEDVVTLKQMDKVMGKLRIARQRGERR